MKETKIRFKLRLDQGTMHLPTQHLIRQIEEVVRSIVRPVRPTSFRSNTLREQGEDLVEVVFRELGFVGHQPSSMCRIQLTGFQLFSIDLEL